LINRRDKLRYRPIYGAQQRVDHSNDNLKPLPGYQPPQYQPYKAVLHYAAKERSGRAAASYICGSDRIARQHAGV
jgi:hypothetical protein